MRKCSNRASVRVVQGKGAFGKLSCGHRLTLPAKALPRPAPAYPSIAPPIQPSGATRGRRGVGAGPARGRPEYVHYAWGRSGSLYESVAYMQGHDLGCLLPGERVCGLLLVKGFRGKCAGA